MELVPVVGVVVVAVIAAAVCVRRASLGNQMDRSLEQLKSHAGAEPRPEVPRRAAPAPVVLARQPIMAGQALRAGQVAPSLKERLPAAARVAPDTESVPKAS